MVKKIISSIRKYIWLYPAIYSFIAIILSIGVIYLDMGHLGVMTELFPSLLLTHTDLAKTILSSVATSLITMTTFTFSSTLVVLTMFSSQFSPRTVENFLSDDKTMKTLGLFLSGFVYSMITLLFMRSSLEDNMVISASISIAYAILCLISFIRYINHVGSYIQTENLIYRLYDVAETRIHEYKTFIGTGIIDTSNPMTQELSGDFIIPSHAKGYIQLIDHHRLIQLAEENHLLIECLEETGAFVDENVNLFRVHFNQGENTLDISALRTTILDTLTIGYRKNDMGDVSFSIHKISEIALRAISPGINDPATAIHCIRMTGLLLGEIASIENGRLLITNDADGIMMNMVTFEEELNRHFYELVHYGKGDISVLSALLDALIMIAKKALPSHLPSILAFGDELYEQMDMTVKQGHGKAVIESKLHVLHEQQ